MQSASRIFFVGWDKIERKRNQTKLNKTKPIQNSNQNETKVKEKNRLYVITFFSVKTECVFFLILQIVCKYKTTVILMFIFFFLNRELVYDHILLSLFYDTQNLFFFAIFVIHK